jgi:hypothetical protein
MADPNELTSVDHSGLFRVLVFHDDEIKPRPVALVTDVRVLVMSNGEKLNVFQALDGILIKYLQ